MLTRKVNNIVMFWIKALTSEGENPIDFAVGGQAVMEGVMMRSPNHITVAVRKQDGTIKIDTRKYQTLTQRFRILNIPIVRGVINLFEMMVVGTKAINFSANEMIEDEMTDEEKVKYRGQKRSKWVKVFESFMFGLSLVLALAFSLFLFKFLPLGATTLIEKYISTVADNYIVFNLIDGAIKMLIFLSYIYILSLFPSFRRIFEYHGAEHKAIFAYESKKGLSTSNAQKQSRFHPRCGTSFILIVFVISILVYTVVPKQPEFFTNLGIRLAFLPLIAGISYEYLKFSARHVDSAFVRILIAPGLLFQRLTTKDPDDSQLEVSLASLKAALDAETK